MRALAQFVMQGRLQASVVAILGIPLLSPAAAALVLLRLGLGAGAFVFAVAIAPAIMMAVASKEVIVALMAALTLASMASVAAGALWLRATQSWNGGLVASVATALVSVMVISLVSPEAVSLMTDEIVKAANSLREQSAVAGVEALVISDRYTLGVMATVTLLGALPCLLLARWWQAVLYNPGGFQREIHSLRLSQVVTVVCVLVTGLCLGIGAALQSWALLFLAPLYLAGIGFVHWLASVRRIGSEWLIVFYLLLIFVAPVRGFIAALAIADSFLNLRGRITPKSQDNRD